MIFAYADPPYPGQAGRYANGSEVNHQLLVAHLETFDGWALSTSAAALLDVWNLAPHARCASWVKTWASNGWSRVRWSWEPVLFVTPSKGIKPGERSEVWDSLVCAPNCTGSWQEVAGKGGGSKPYEFVRWMLDLLGFQDGDELVDIFPGSGVVTRHASVETPELFVVERAEKLCPVHGKKERWLWGAWVCLKCDLRAEPNPQRASEDSKSVRYP